MPLWGMGCTATAVVGAGAQADRQSALLLANSNVVFSIH